MGCDLFDSAAYILYAEDDRLLMPNGTIKLENLHEMPCSCEVCTNYARTVASDGKSRRVQQIAKHNLLISFAEIRQIRQAIVQGNLWELVEQRCRSHPFLLEALRTLYNYSERSGKKYDPPYKKSAFFYSGPESLKRPEVYRHLKKLDGISQKKSVFTPS